MNVANERPRTQGRPRSEPARQAVLAATYKLLGTTSVRDLTIDAIAQEAGVGKATIYRWWTNKNAVIIDTFIAHMLPEAEVPSTPSCLKAIQGHLALVVDQYRGDVGHIVAQLLAEGQFDPALREALRERFFVDRRAAVSEVLHRGVASKEFCPQLDIDTTIDALYGAIYFRLLLGHAGVTPAFAKSLGVMARRLLLPS
jgi:AcrR family transcriptional regulator